MGFLARVAGRIAALVLVTLVLCRCGSAFSAATALKVSDDAGENGAGNSDATIVVVPYPPDAQTPIVVDSAPDSPAADAGSPPCNPMGDPKDEPCLVDDASGVFVSGTNGRDAALGTKLDPLKTIAEGIAKATGATMRVFACAGSYDEHVVVGATHDGIGVYGGFDCANWTYASGNSVMIAPSTAGYALEVDSLKVGATFEDVEFDSQSAKVAGTSSVAVFANQSVVTFRRVVAIAGDGAAGTQGDAGSNYTVMQPPNGNNGDGGAGGARKLCNCLNGDQSAGGAGGGAGPPPTAGLSGSPDLGGGKPGLGGDLGCASGGIGHAGANASDPVATTSVAVAGALTDHGWSPAPGNVGAIAPVAQGGGGGGGNASFQLNDAGASVTGGGGSGGCGGCGGGGGTPGAGGGSSFAVLSYKSTLVLVDSRLTARDGKDGGKGGKGQAGQLGGYAGISSQPGCQGGNGGTGGSGGGGGGGAGGVSAAIGYVGDPPTEMGTVSKTIGNFGAGGAGGIGGGANNAGGKGKDGVASAVLAL